jgi:hypothetical protein
MHVAKAQAQSEARRRQMILGELGAQANRAAVPITLPKLKFLDT